MSIFGAMRRFFNPGDPIIQTRDEMMTMEQRAAAGLTLYPTHQINRPLWQTGNIQRYVSEGWSKSSVVAACVLALADAVATAPLVSMRETTDGMLEPESGTDLQRLLASPNRSMSQAEFLQMIVVISALSGFCVIEKERSKAGKVIALWPLRSDWVKPVPRDQSAPAWEYRVPGHRSPFILEPGDVIVHTHAPDPSMGYTGTSPMSIAFRELGIENAMTDFLKGFFDRGAVPQYGIIPRQQITNQEQADAFLERIRGRFQQTNGGPMLLTGVEDIKRIGFDFDELAYPTLRALTETKICTAFRVPPILVGIEAGLKASTYSNYGQARRSFYEDVISSLWNRLDGAFTRGLVYEFDTTGSTVIDFDTGDVPALKDDEKELWLRATEALRAGGISTHAFQRLVRLDTHGPDVIYQPFSVVPIKIGSTERKAARMQGNALPPSALHVELPLPLPDGRIMRSVGYGSDEHIHRWERRVSMGEHWEQRFGEALAAQMEEQRQEILVNLSDGTRERRELPLADPFDRDKWIRAFKVTMRPVVQGIMGEAAIVAADELGLTFAFDVHDPRVIEAMERQLQRFAEEVNDTTWNHLRDSLAEGIADGETIDQLAERVGEVMDGRIRSSKETIARTEVTAASTNGTIESWRQSGVVDKKAWLAAMDDRTRETHTHAHGQVVGLDEDFSVGAATGPGPGMMSSAAESANCRCSLIPVIN